MAFNHGIDLQKEIIFMHAHYLQHVPFEGLGSIESWLHDHDYTISHTALFASQQLPTPADIDFLIILGGPMSVHDETAYPWLIQEKAFVKEFLTSGKPILGICLGAQLIANVLGANVYPGPEKEIGWFPITACTTDTESFSFAPTLTAFHWHEETFDLPENAKLLASSTACCNQAFQIGTNIIGLQFHLETTPTAADNLISNCQHEMTPAPYVQSAAEIQYLGEKHYASIHNKMARLLKYLTRDTPA